MTQTPNVQIGFGARLFSNKRTASEEIGGLPKSGSYGKDTDKALVTSHNHLKSILEDKT